MSQSNTQRMTVVSGVLFVILSVIGLGSLAGLVFVAGVVSMMWRNEASRTLAIIAGVGGAGAIAMFLVGSGLFTLLAYRPAIDDPGLLRAEFDGGSIMFNASGFMLAA